MKFQRRLKPDSAVNLVPMIDVVFQLLVFFMVSSTFNLTPALTLTLPESRTAESTAVPSLTITIQDAQNIWVNQELNSLVTLERRLSGYSPEERQALQTVQVLGAETVSYQLLVQVLDALRLAGFQGVSLKMREAQP